MQSILIVDDLESIHEMLDAVIQPIGYHTAFATDGEIALRKIREEHYDIVLTDINMKPMDGLALLEQIKEADPNAIVIMMSGYANVDNATRALKLGAFDFLTKPFKVDQLMASISRASSERKKRLEAGSVKAGQNTILLAGDSEAARTLSDRIHRAAKLPTPLLVTGETGTQKASVVAMVHAKSPLSEGPIVTLDAKTADPEALVAELFDEEGKPGETVQAAQGGFVHIANIDRFPLDKQAALGNLIRDLKGETRIVCSSSRDLEQLIEAGKFEDALYFRIANNALPIPSLRDRSEDLPAMALAYFAQNNLPQSAIGEQASALLQAYRWPGNYDELQEILAAAATVADDQTIHEQDLPESLRDTSHWPNLEEFLAQQSQRYRSQVLQACQGDKAKAAQILACDPSDL